MTIEELDTPCVYTCVFMLVYMKGEMTKSPDIFLVKKVSARVFAGQSGVREHPPFFRNAWLEADSHTRAFPMRDACLFG